MIGIIDYGAGNLGSVLKAFSSIGAGCRVLQKAEKTDTLKRLVLPGVGAFCCCIDNLKSNGFDEMVFDWLRRGRPYLGICLGMQVLFEGSEESPAAKGFGIFRGKAIRFCQNKVPQMGWNRVKRAGWSKLMYDIADNSFFYFLHAYYVPLPGSGTATGISDYGVEYTSVIEKDNICAVQFHPEKSGRTGLRMLKNWVDLC